MDVSGLVLVGIAVIIAIGIAILSSFCDKRSGKE